eukprot:TRINITY_DN2881_c0_g1_i8.p1 TRINITY_DN2881_c0_g1~~TRINITY_DN2881_c0_g1_i8.p1  ORF type:complete len:514 (+),score=138.66 TRINITY_DN2881_c0_g1_i8:116-1657(+)
MAYSPRVSRRLVPENEDGEDTFSEEPAPLMSVGRLPEERKQALSGVLQIRSERQSLVDRNIIRDAVEDKMSSPRIDNRSQKLSAFLQNRPSREHLQQINVIKGGHTNLSAKSLALQQQRTHDSLSQFIAHRPSLSHLMQRGILQGGVVEEKDENSIVSTPTHVEALAGTIVQQVSCGWAHTAVITYSGELWTFGFGENGRLGLGNEETSHVPRVVTSLRLAGSVTQVSCGDNHTAALVNGQLYTWGVGSWGRLGLGDQSDVWVPTLVSRLAHTTVTQVAAGGYHTLALTDGGDVFSFGWLKNGRLGLSEPLSEECVDRGAVVSPLQITSLSQQQVVRVAAGESSSAAVTADGRLYTWGSGAFGCLGHGQVGDETTPRVVEGLPPVTLVACGAHHMLTLTAGGLYSWGRNHYGQLGRESPDTPTPGVVTVDTAQGTVVAAGKTHSAFIAGGTLYSWGRGEYTGHQVSTSSPRPVHVQEASGWQAAACGWSHSAFVTSGGSLYTVGSKFRGHLGL